ncbi:MAG: abortive phage infection protein [Snowella sp.]|nr:MAG: abortive phage infection protein [Snowella sp.]
MAKKEKNFRGYSSRKVNIKEVKQRFLIVCEGAKTEPNYFKNFRVPKTVIDVKGVGENPSRLVQSAIKLKAEADEEYDQIWCVFDRDDWPPQDFNNAIYKAESHNLKVAYSNEAFELWYVLHFEFLNTGIPRDDYCKKMTRLLGKKYQKNSDIIYDELINKQPTAMAMVQPD